MTRRTHSIAPAWFDDQYARDRDPWKFATSPYEQQKYAATLAALPPDRRFARAFEVGCSIGVFTQLLAPRCDELLACDVSEMALAAARHRCASPHIQIERRRIPEQWPAGSFDLLVFSEVLYYLDPTDLTATAARARDAMAPGALALLVHYLGETDYPLSGDEAADQFLAALGEPVTRRQRTPLYRIDTAG